MYCFISIRDIPKSTFLLFVGRMSLLGECMHDAVNVKSVLGAFVLE